MPITVEPPCPPETTVELPRRDATWSTKGPGLKSTTVNENGTTAASLQDTELDGFMWTETSYPSNCLRFLQDIKPGNGEKGVCAVPRQANIKLEIVIVGAGLGGLATATALVRRGHKVRVFEQAEQLAEVCGRLKRHEKLNSLLTFRDRSVLVSKSRQTPESFCRDGVSLMNWPTGLSGLTAFRSAAGSPGLLSGLQTSLIHLSNRSRRHTTSLTVLICILLW